MLKELLHQAWQNFLPGEFELSYFKQLELFLENEWKNYTIYPPKEQIFTAFNQTPPDNVKVVLVGQDPYHGQGQAHGLAFSVSPGIKQPPSLKNIFKELYNDLQIVPPLHGYLTDWAKQGVLLINATLTVRAKTAGSHQKKGWENFTDKVIRQLSEKKEKLVFLLWGNFAQSKAALIDDSNHLILKSAHPSPFSANRGFFGSKHFSQTNQYLEKNGIEPINWTIAS